MFETQQASYEEGVNSAYFANEMYDSIAESIDSINTVQRYLDETEMPEQVRQVLMTGMSGLKEKLERDQETFRLAQNEADDYFTGLYVRP